MTLAFGTQQMTGFTLWGFYGIPGMYSGSAGSVLVRHQLQHHPRRHGLRSVAKLLEHRLHLDRQRRRQRHAPWHRLLRRLFGESAARRIALSLVKGTSNYSLTVPIGDYNGDGIVDAADYAIWRDTLGSTTDLRADGDGDGVIDPGDYDTWAAKVRLRVFQRRRCQLTRHGPRANERRDVVGRCLRDGSMPRDARHPEALTPTTARQVDVAAESAA